MFNPMPDISQRAIIIFYVCVVVLSGCNYNSKAPSDGKRRPINNGFVLHCLLYGHLIFLTRNYVLQVRIAAFPMRSDYTSYAPRRPASVRPLLYIACVPTTPTTQSDRSKRCHLSWNTRLSLSQCVIYGDKGCRGVRCFVIVVMKP